MRAFLVWSAIACFAAGCPTDPVSMDADSGRDAGSDRSVDAEMDGASETDSGSDSGVDTAEGDAGPPLRGCDLLLSLSGADLIDALFESVDGHRHLSYDGAREAMYGVTGNVDVIDGVIESVYTGETIAPDGSRAPGGVFNTEHSWPRSQGANSSPAVSDMHHLFPCDEASNNRRGTLPFGITDCDLTASCGFSSGGSELGLDEFGDEVFEVRAARRGDIARALFYFSIRYRLPIDDTEEGVLRRWHEEDPPDTYEIDRTGRIEAYQANRNPFVDCADIVAQLDDF